MVSRSATRQQHVSDNHREQVVLPRAVGQLARDAVRRALVAWVRRAVSTRRGLILVNRLHRTLTAAQKRRFFYLCCDEPCRVEGPWVVGFGGRRLVLPLHRDFELGWLAATGFHGYDTEIHELYEALVRSPWAPRVFLDVGANYGLHSLKLLAHGVRVVSFEPNIDCHPFFLEACRINGMQPDVRAVAVGRTAGVTTLVFPAGRTYLGTTASETVERWDDAADLVERSVPEVTLDDVVRAEALVPDLIKIDTEGSELAVLEGAETILKRMRPLVVLESWRASAARPSLFRLLAGHGYRLHALRFGTGASAGLSLDAFLASAATNFLARPALPTL